MRMLTRRYSWMLWHTKQVGAAQGNTEADMSKWGDRVHVAAWDLTTDVAATAKAINSSVALIEEFRADEKANYLDVWEATGAVPTTEWKEKSKAQ